MPIILSCCESAQLHVLITASVIVFVSCLGGCGPDMPIASRSCFGDPANSRARVLPSNAYAEPPHKGAVLVIMEPAADGLSPRHDFSVEDFRSPTGSKGKGFIHHPKGITEMRLIAYDVNIANSDMVFEWRVVQNGQAIQTMRARVLPGPPVRVFVDGQEIEVLQD